MESNKELFRPTTCEELTTTLTKEELVQLYDHKKGGSLNEDFFIQDDIKIT